MYMAVSIHSTLPTLFSAPQGLLEGSGSQPSSYTGQTSSRPRLCATGSIVKNILMADLAEPYP